MATSVSPAVHGGGGASQKGGAVWGKKGNPPRAVSAVGRDREDPFEQSRTHERCVCVGGGVRRDIL